MYLAYYNLRANPFQISTNPAFLWLGEKHREALATLRYGVVDNKGFLLLTGDVGTGKTTLVNSLLASLEEDVVAAAVPDPGLAVMDFFRYVAGVFRITEPFASKGEFLLVFRRFLEAVHAEGKRVLLIIDEAQRLTPELLEEIRLLSNIELPDTKLLNIFFVGQDEFNGLLLRQENRAIRQRITARYDIKPLTIGETDEYVRHRLQVAGCDRQLFSPAAIQQLHVYSRGYPRLINVLADRCLITGFVDEVAEIGPNIVMECAQELQIPLPTPVVEEAATAAPPPVAATAGDGPAAQPVPGENPAPDPAPAAEPAAAQPPRRRGAGLWLVVFVLLAVAGFLAWQRWPEQGGRLVAGVEQAVERGVARLHGLTAGGGEGDRPPAPVVPQPPPEQGAARDAAPASVAPEPVSQQEEEPVAMPPAGEKETPPPAATGTVAEVTPAAAGGAGEGSLVAPAAAAAPETAPPAPAAAASPAVPPLPAEPVVVRFQFSSNELLPSGRQKLDRLAAALAGRPYRALTVVGYTDNTGPEELNRHLSLMRANLVKYYLMGHGIPSERIETVGRGPADPVASNDTREGRMLNRRVEIVVHHD